MFNLFISQEIQSEGAVPTVVDGRKRLADERSQ